MNARQKAKKLKKEINTLKSDNDLMRGIIKDSPAMQELYDAYNKPKFVTYNFMRFQEFRVERIITTDMKDLDGFIKRAEPALEKALFEEIKEYITYEVNDKDIAPTITASIFIGEKE